MDRYKEFTSADEIRISAFRKMLTRNQKAIVWMIHLFSHAMGKQSAVIPNFECFALCGIEYKRVSKELSELVRLNVITWDFGKGEFRIKDPSEWELPINEEWKSEMFEELLDLNIEHRDRMG